MNRFSREEMGGIVLNAAEAQSAVISWCHFSKTTSLVSLSQIHQPSAELRE